jgi:hypothetical protein
VNPSGQPPASQSAPAHPGAFASVVAGTHPFWSSRAGRYFPPLLVFALAAAIFLPILAHGFTNWDDNWLVTDNRWIRSFSAENLSAVLNPWAPQDIREELGNEYLPVRDLSYMVNYALHGYSPMGWHLTDLLLNALNAVLVWWLALRLFRQPAVALLSGLLFAVMPIHVEAVAWVSCRKDLLAALFVLLSVHCYLTVRLRPAGNIVKSPPPAQGPPPPAVAQSSLTPSDYRWLGLSLLCFLLALFSKVPAICLPGLLVALELFARPALRPMPFRRIAVHTSAFFAVALFVFIFIAYPIANTGLVREPFGGDWRTNTATALRSLTGYVWGSFSANPVTDARVSTSFFGDNSVWGPLEPTANGYRDQWHIHTWLFAGIMVISMVKYLLPSRQNRGRQRTPESQDQRKEPPPLTYDALSLRGFGWGLVLLPLAWTLLAFLPVSNFIVVTGTVYADRYAYLPSVGIALLCVIVLSCWIRPFPDKSRKVSNLELSCLCGILGFLVVICAATTAQTLPAWSSSTSLWNAVLKRDPENHIALFNRSRTFQEHAAAVQSPATKRGLLAFAATDMQAALDHPARSYRYDPARCLGGLAKIELDLAVIDRGQADAERDDARKAEREAERCRLAAINSRSSDDHKLYVVRQEEQDERVKTIESRRESNEKSARAHLSAALAHLTRARESANFDLPWRIERDRQYLAAELFNYEGLAKSMLGDDDGAEKAFDLSARQSKRAPAAYINWAASVARRAADLARDKGYSDVTAGLFAQALAKIDAYDAARRYRDIPSLSARAEILAMQAEAIEGAAAVIQPAAAAALYREASKILDEAAAAVEPTAPSAKSQLYDLATKRAETTGRIAPSDPKQAAAALDDALEAAKRAAALEEGLPVNQLKVARLLLQQGKTKEAREELEAIVKAQPDFEPARLELAAVHVGYAKTLVESLRQKWQPEFDELRRTGKLRIFKTIEKDKPVQDHMLIAEFHDRPEFLADLKPVTASFEEVLRLAPKSSDAAHQGAAYLSTLGQAEYTVGNEADAEKLLRRSFGYDEELKITSELLGAIYFRQLEFLVKRSGEAQRSGSAEVVEDLATQMWEMVRNLVLISPRAATVLAAKITRQTNELRVPIDERYTERVEAGEDPVTHEKLYKERIAPDRMPDYIRDMQPIIRSYEMARTLDNEQPDALSQLNDYYSKTGQYRESLKAYEAQAKTLEKRPKDLFVVRQSIASLLYRWGFTLDARYREAVRKGDDAAAKKYRDEAIGILLEAAAAWKVVLDMGGIKPERHIIESAGAVHQKLSVLDLPHVTAHVDAAVAIYGLNPAAFRVELCGMYRKLALHEKESARRLLHLRAAREFADGDEDKATIDDRIATLEANEAIPRARALLKAGRFGDALDELDNVKVTTWEANAVRGDAKFAMGRIADAAMLYYSCYDDAQSQLRAGELFLDIADGKGVPAPDDTALGKAQRSFTRAYSLFEEKLIDQSAADADVTAVRASLAAVEKHRDTLLSRSAALVDEARKLRERNENDDKRIRLLTSAADIAPGNYEALALLAVEMRDRARIRRDVEARLKREKGDKPGEAAKLKLAADEFGEAANYYLAAIRLDSPFSIAYRLDYAALLINELSPLLEGDRRESAIRAASTALDYAEADIRKRERDAPGGSTAIYRTRLDSLKSAAAAASPK